MFTVGQRVRCVNGSFSYNVLDWARRFPATGDIYTVRAVAQQPHYLDRSAGLALWLEEIVNPPLSNGIEPSFSAWRFRELEEATAEANSNRQHRPVYDAIASNNPLTDSPR